MVLENVELIKRRLSKWQRDKTGQNLSFGQNLTFVAFLKSTKTIYRLLCIVFMAHLSFDQNLKND